MPEKDLPIASPCDEKIWRFQRAIEFLSLAHERGPEVSPADGTEFKRFVEGSIPMCHLEWVRDERTARPYSCPNTSTCVKANQA